MIGLVGRRMAQGGARGVTLRLNAMAAADDAGEAARLLRGFVGPTQCGHA
jgi:hypothetical protein